MNSIVRSSPSAILRCSSYMASPSLRCYSMTSMIDQIISDIANDSTKKNTATVSKPTPPKPGFALRKEFNSFPRNDHNERLRYDNNNTERLRYDNKNNRSKNFNNGSVFKVRDTRQRIIPRQRPKQQLQFTSGSERLQQLFLTVLKKVQEANPRGNVSEIQPSGIVETNIMTVFQSLDLSKQGVEIIKVEENSEGELIPFIRLVDLKKAGQNYSNYLHEELTKNSGLTPKKKNAQSNNKEGKVKQYKLNWNLSINDLVNVKLKEINNKILKNNKVEIFLGSKNDLKNVGENFVNQIKDDVASLDKQIDEIEKIKRDKIVDTILQFVEQQQETNKIVIKQKGDTVNRVFITLKLEKPIEKAKN